MNDAVSCTRIGTTLAARSCSRDGCARSAVVVLAGQSAFAWSVRIAGANRYLDHDPVDLRNVSSELEPPTPRWLKSPYGDHLAA